MAADPGVLKRLSALETRVKALELRGADTQLARLTDDPPTIQNAFALREIVRLARTMAQARLSADLSDEMGGEALNWLDAMK